MTVPSEAVSAIPDGFPQDGPHWYRRWLQACELLDEEGAKQVDGHVRWSEGFKAGVAAERDRLRQLVAAMRATDAYGLPEYDGSLTGLAGYRCGEMDTLTAVRRLLREPS